MDRELTVDFPFFNQDVGGGAWQTTMPTGYEPITQDIFKYEATIDLGGYEREDLTVFFRRSFEQLGGYDNIGWTTYDANTDAILQNTIVSSVPLTDEQLRWSLLVQPGFTPFSTAVIDFGNFNREHIIHGRFELAYANAIVGAGAFGAVGNAALVNLADNYYSSLEPTAADTLYCYRVIGLPDPGTTGIRSVNMPAKRIIMDAFTSAEPELEYMMRLKRSYELANQV